MKTAPIDRNCPTCLNIEVTSTPVVFSKRPAEKLSFDTLKDYWRGFFKEKVFFTYYRCSRCGGLFSREFFNAGQLTELYSNMPDNTAGVSVQTVQKTQRGYFKLLERYSPLKGEMLEVGPDIGLFTEFCRKKGDFKRFWMFEPNQAVHEELKNRIAGVETLISTDLFSFDSVPNKTINVVVLIHVLDHLLDPKKTLEDLYKKMLPGAQIMIVTHNELSILAKLMGTKWVGYCLQHPQLYNPQSISKLLEDTGFKVVTVNRTVNYFPLMFLVRHLLWTIGIKRLWLPSLNWLQFPLRLGNICTVATVSDF